jgi:hypothetical protein
MNRTKLWQELRNAFEQFLTQSSVCEDEEEMRFWIDAFTKEIATQYTEEELSDKLGSVDDMLGLFQEFLRRRSR